MSEGERAIDDVIRQRIRELRLSRGWSLDSLAARSGISPSTLSRIETGGRRIGLDHLVPLARALEIGLDQLLEEPGQEDVVIRPQRRDVPGMTMWILSQARTPRQMNVVKMRMTEPAPREQRVHPGRDWFLVLSGTAELRLGDRFLLVETGQVAEFSTLTPHSFGGHRGPVELLSILTAEGERAHVPPEAHTAEGIMEP